MKQRQATFGAVLIALSLVVSTPSTTKADPFVAGLIVGAVAHGILSHVPPAYPPYGYVYPYPYREHYYKRLYYGVPEYPEPRPYREACVRGPKTCYEQDECWRDADGRPQCGIRRYCRRRVYCD